MAATTHLLLPVLACILCHVSWAQQLGRVPPVQISVSNPGEHGLIPSQPFFPAIQSLPNTRLDPSAHHQEHSNAHLGEVQGQGIAVQDHAYRAPAPGTVQTLAPVVLQALRAIQSKQSSTQVKEQDHLNEIPERSQRTHRREPRLVHPLQRSFTGLYPFFSSAPTSRHSPPNMDVKLRSIVPEEHIKDKFLSSPTRSPANHHLHKSPSFEDRPQSINAVTSPPPIQSIPSSQHSDLGLLSHHGFPDIKSRVSHPLFNPQFQRPVAPPTTGFLHTDTQRQQELGISLTNLHQSNDHHTKNQTPKLTTKVSSKSTEPFLAVLGQSSPNSKGKDFPDYDDEDYYYYDDDYDDTYYDDYDYGLSGGPVTPLPFHVTTTNHVEIPVTTTQPSVTTRTRSRGPITPPPSLFPVRPGQTASPTSFHSSTTKQPFHSSIDNEKQVTSIHHSKSASIIIDATVTPRHQGFNVLQTPPQNRIQQPHPLHEFFIGDTSGIELKQRRRFPTSTDSPISACPECTTNPDKLIFPASPPGLRAPLSQDTNGTFNPDESQTLVLSEYFLHHLHHDPTTAVPDHQHVYFTPKRSIAQNPGTGGSVLQTSSTPLKRLRRRKRRRKPSDYAVDNLTKQRRHRVPQHAGNNKDISDLTNQNNFLTKKSVVRGSLIQNLKNESPIKTQQIDFDNPRRKLARRNPTRKSRRITNKVNSSLLVTSDVENRTKISPVTATYSRLPLLGLTASKQKLSHTRPPVVGITVRPRGVTHLTQITSSNNGNSPNGFDIGHAIVNPFSGVPTLESASPEEIYRAAAEAVQGWRQDLNYPVVDLPLPSAALSGLPFFLDGHGHLGTFVMVPVT